MNDPHNHDQSFGDDRLSAIYRQSRTDEPPMKLDSAILSDARKAVEKRARWWRAAWIAPVATASVAVLAVAIGMMNKSMLEKQEAIIEPAADTMPMGDRLENRLEEKPESQLTSEPAPKPEERRDAEKMLLGNAPAKRQAPAAPSASGAAAPASEGMEQERAPATMKQRAAPKMERRSREAPATAPATAPAPQQFTNEQDAEMATEMDQATPQAADKPLEPEAWLEKIRELKAAGRDEEAARELELFAKAYPDYELPADLKQSMRP